MLVLSRKVGERILIGENIAVTIVRISSGVVRIGIEAPPETPIVREELKTAARERQTPAAAQTKPEVPVQSVTASPNEAHARHRGA